MPSLPSPLLPLVLTLGLAPAQLLDAPRPPGASLSLRIESGAEVSAGALDLAFDAEALRARLDLSEGPRAGQSLVVLLSRTGAADRYYAYRPALGVSPLRAPQAERLLVEVGVGVQDVVQLLYPARAGGAEAWAVDGDALLAPADAAGCRDRYQMGAGPLPEQVTLCPEEPWGERQIRLSAPFELGGATLPGRLEVAHADGSVVSVQLAPAEAARWQDPARFTREGLGGT
ncbi:MAG: hypothetical protein H6740_04350 [Alphaproteobacteria bacterium]|nr:hypothetical protein [Alphaproteobacteria bacterium]